jgi:programmed cell death protein 5
MNEEVNPEELRKVEELKKIIIRNILTKEAVERLGRIRLIKPDLALQLELYLVQLFQAGKLRGQINDEQLKTILDGLTSKKQFKIIK